MLPIEKFRGHKTESRAKDRNKGKASAKKQVERGGTIGDIR